MKSQEKNIRILVGLQGSRFGLREIIQDSERKRWTFLIEPDEQPRLCGKCHREAAKHSLETIKLRDLPVGVEAAEVIWRVKRWRVNCETCGHGVEHLPFRSPVARMTKRLHEQIESVLSNTMVTVKDAARMFHLHWDTVFKIDLHMLLERYRNAPIPSPRNISVDEKSFKRGHKYLTLIIDVDLKKVIYVSIGRSKKSLDEFFQFIGKERCKAIESIAMDLHADYWASVREHCPKALHVPDKFHIVQRLNQAIDEALRELVYKQTGTLAYGLPRDVRWLIKRNLDNQKQRHMLQLEELKEKNEPLFEAYLLKDYFLHFFGYSSDQIEEAKLFLTNWVTEAWKTGLKALQDFAEYVKRNQKILLNVILTGRTSSISEGINNKIGKIIAAAYGYQKWWYLSLKILQRCGILHSPLKSG